MKLHCMLALLGLSILLVASPSKPIVATHGVAIGEVGAHQACLWSRASQPCTMHVVLTPRSGKQIPQYRSTKITAKHDFCGKVVFYRLRANCTYDYSISFSSTKKEKQNSQPNTINGFFKTAPKAQDEQEVSFVWGGDIGGQNVGRDAKEGYSVFQTIKNNNPDFFIGLGDMIYADNPIHEKGRYGNDQIVGPKKVATLLPEFWDYWKYNRADVHWQKLVSEVPFFGVWDDHEVSNDFGPLHIARKNENDQPTALINAGLQSFLDYNPIVMFKSTPYRLYRKTRWGKHLEVFILDNRQYRDSNLTKDNPKYPKTMLGREQLTWLKAGLKNSDATWKVIVSSVPISIPTGYPPEINGKDGWADDGTGLGFEGELRNILRYMQQQQIRNIVWVTTDVHFATGFRYQPFEDDSNFEIHEFVSGPMAAGIFPTKVYDKTFNPTRLFFHGPKSMFADLTYEQAKKYFNFGLIKVDKSGKMNVQIRNANDKVVYNTVFIPRK